jgi:hypothetical protein
LQEKICNSFGYTRGKHFQSHFAFVDQPFSSIYKISLKKKKKKRERKGMKCFLMVGFQFTKVLNFFFLKEKR